MRWWTLRKLRSNDPGKRLLAVKDLYISRDSRAVESLVEALGDENDAVRCEAAESLGFIGDARAIPGLVAMLDSPRWIAEWLFPARALTLLNWHPETLTQQVKLAISNRSFETLALAVSQSVDLLLDLLQPGPEYARFGRDWWENQYTWTIHAFLHLDGAAIESLAAAIKKRGGSSRTLAAAESLALMGDQRGVDHLKEQILQEGELYSPDSRRALRALGRIGSEAAFKALISVLNLNQTKTDVRAEVVTELARAGEQSIPVLEGLLGESPDIQIRALRALNQLGWKPETEVALKETERIVCECLKDIQEKYPRIGLFEKSVELLSELGEERAVEPLINILERSDSIHNHQIAARALGIIGDPRAAKRLVAEAHSSGIAEAVAMGLLQLLKKSRVDIEEEVLHTIIALDEIFQIDVNFNFDGGFPPKRGPDIRRKVDCSEIKNLAEEELLRRKMGT